MDFGICQASVEYIHYVFFRVATVPPHPAHLFENLQTLACPLSLAPNALMGSSLSWRMLWSDTSGSPPSQLGSEHLILSLVGEGTSSVAGEVSPQLLVTTLEQLDDLVLSGQPGGPDIVAPAGLEVNPIFGSSG